MWRRSPGDYHKANMHSKWTHLDPRPEIVIVHERERERERESGQPISYLE